MNPNQSANFDVIIYDQLEAPTLWMESNADKSDHGRLRIIPAEYVKAIIEVKSAFNRRTVGEAILKLSELAAFAAGVDAPGERYPKYLPPTAVFTMIFFECRKADAHDVEALHLIRDCRNLGRSLYPPMILRGEGHLIGDASALVETGVSDTPMDAIWTDGGLLSFGHTITASRESKGKHYLAMLGWTDVNFSRFAFDLLAILNGTFRSGFVSSFHGLNLQDRRGRE